jgi:hypothetical protein
VLGAQFREAVLPAEAAQQPGSCFKRGAIANGQLPVLRVEPLNCRGEVSHRPSLFVAPRRALHLGDANFSVPMTGVTQVTAP